MSKKYDKPRKKKPKEPKEVEVKEVKLIVKEPEEEKKKPDPKNLYAKVKTTAELEVELKKRHPNLTSVDLKGLDLESARESADQYTRLSKEHPEEAASVFHFGKKGGALTGMRIRGVRGSWAYVMALPGRDPKTGDRRPQQAIVLNTSVYGKGKRQLFESQLKESAASDWHPKSASTVRGVLTHEFGHVVHNYYQNSEAARRKTFTSTGTISSGDSGSYSYLFRSWMSDAHIKSRVDMRSQGPGVDSIKNSPWFVSRYAMKNEKENFAEAFSALHEGDKSSRYTRQLGEVLYLRKISKESTGIDDSPNVYQTNREQHTQHLSRILSIQ